MADEPERFAPTSGRWTGSLTLLVGLALVAWAVLDGPPGQAWSLGLGGVFLAAAAWAVLLRPRVSLTETTLELRNVLDTVHLPLAGIESMVIRQVTALRVGHRRYVSSALGRSMRSLMRGDRGAGPPKEGSPQSAPAYVDFVESRIRSRMDDARARMGIRNGSPEQKALVADVRRQPAVPEILSLTLSGLGFLLTLVF